MGQVVSIRQSAIQGSDVDDLDAARATLRGSAACLAKTISDLKTLRAFDRPQTVEALINSATTLILKIEALDLKSKTIKADLANVLELSRAFHVSCTAWRETSRRWS